MSHQVRGKIISDFGGWDKLTIAVDRVCFLCLDYFVKLSKSGSWITQAELTLPGSVKIIGTESPGSETERSLKLNQSIKWYQLKSKTPQPSCFRQKPSVEPRMPSMLNVIEDSLVFIGKFLIRVCIVECIASAYLEESNLFPISKIFLPQSVPFRAFFKTVGRPFEGGRSVVSKDLSVFILPKKQMGKRFPNFLRKISSSPSVFFSSCHSHILQPKKRFADHQTPRPRRCGGFFRWFCEVVLWTPWVCQGRARARPGH